MTGCLASVLCCVASLLALSGCAFLGSKPAEDAEATSGSSLPPARAPEAGAITGAVLLPPGAGGMDAAGDFAREICEGFHRGIKLGGAYAAKGVTRLTYSCE
jgi:hypothetical protein